MRLRKSSKTISVSTGMPKNKGGRPSKFDASKHLIKAMALKGWTDVEISKALQITEVTLNNWKKKDAKFFQSLKDWKLQADADVVKSLYERAKGYSCTETKAQWVHDEAGGRWETVEMVKHYPPDPTSMIYWTKNRMPKEWRDKQAHEVSGPGGLPITVFHYPGDDKDG